MKAAKKRYYKREPEFWKVLKSKHKPKKDWILNWDINSMYPGELTMLYAARGTGKSMLFDKMYLNSVYRKATNLWISYESSKKEILQEDAGVLENSAGTENQ